MESSIAPKDVDSTDALPPPETPVLPSTRTVPGSARPAASTGAQLRIAAVAEQPGFATSLAPAIRSANNSGSP